MVWFMVGILFVVKPITARFSRDEDVHIKSKRSPFGYFSISVLEDRCKAEFIVCVPACMYDGLGVWWSGFSDMTKMCMTQMWADPGFVSGFCLLVCDGIVIFFQVFDIQVCDDPRYHN